MFCSFSVCFILYRFIHVGMRLRVVLKCVHRGVYIIVYMCVYMVMYIYVYIYVYMCVCVWVSERELSDVVISCEKRYFFILFFCSLWVFVCLCCLCCLFVLMPCECSYNCSFLTLLFLSFFLFDGGLGHVPLKLSTIGGTSRIHFFLSIASVCYVISYSYPCVVFLHIAACAQSFSVLFLCLCNS